MPAPRHLGLVTLLALPACGLAEAPRSTDREPLDREAVAPADRELRAGQVEAALRLFDELATREPSSIRAARGVQDARRLLEPEENWRNSYEVAVTQRPQDAVAWYLAGRARASDPAAANEAWTRSRDLDPLLPWPSMGLAWLHGSAGDLYEAVESLRTGVERAPRSGILRKSLARQYRELFLFVEAERQIAAARSLLPGDPEVDAEEALLWAAEGDLERARPVLERLILDEPWLTELWPAVARARLQAGDVEGASQAMDAALAAGERPDPGLGPAIRTARIVEASRARARRADPGEGR